MPHTFSKQVELEANRIQTKHNGFNSLHEAYAVLLEEVDELWDEVKKKKNKRNLKNMTKELIQISAVCQVMLNTLRSL